MAFNQNELLKSPTRAKSNRSDTAQYRVPQNYKTTTRVIALNIEHNIETAMPMQISRPMISDGTLADFRS